MAKIRAKVDGIELEFESVEDLNEFIAIRKIETKPDPKHEPLPMIQLEAKTEFITRKKRHGFTESEKEVIVNAYKDDFAKGRLKARMSTITKLARKFKCSRRALYYFASNCKEISAAKRLKIDNAKNSDYMLREKPVVPLDTAKYPGACINKAGKGSISMADLEFPDIYPLTDDSNKVFERMLIDMIGRKSKISYFDCQHALQLKDNFEWSGRQWHAFVEQFQGNIARIAKALGCNPQKLRVIIERGYEYIAYG